MTEPLPQPDPSSTRSPAAGEAHPRPASRAEIDALFYAGLLTRDTHGAALEAIGSERRWRRNANVLLLILGLGLVMAGIVFFVAYNWHDMDKAVKLGGLQLLVVATTAGALWRGVDHLAGRALLFVACVSVGIFLTAYGQVYQTGADSYELFRGWAGLIVLWVVASRAPAHWLLLLLIVDLAIACYFEQVQLYRWMSSPVACLTIAGTQILALAAFELVRRTSYFVVPQTWPRWVLVPAILFFLVVPTTALIIDTSYVQPGGFETLATLVGFLAVGYWVYRHILTDVFALTCGGFACLFVALAYIARLFNLFHGGDCSSLPILGVLCIAGLATLVRWIRRVYAGMPGDRE